MEKQGCSRGTPKGTQALPWLHGQEPAAAAQGGTAAISQDIGIHIHKQDSKRQMHPWFLWSLSWCFSISRAAGVASAFHPLTPALLPEPPVLPQPSTSTLGWDAGGAQAEPSVACGAAQEPAWPAQEQSAKHSVPQCQQCLSETAGCLPGFKCCLFSADPTTYRDETLSTGVVRKSLFFRVSTWCILLIYSEITFIFI